jgi:hypothetical protein
MCRTQNEILECTGSPTQAPVARRGADRRVVISECLSIDELCASSLGESESSVNPNFLG